MIFFSTTLWRGFLQWANPNRSIGPRLKPSVDQAGNRMGTVGGNGIGDLREVGLLFSSSLLPRQSIRSVRN